VASLLSLPFSIPLPFIFQEAKESIDEEDPRPTSSNGAYIIPSLILEGEPPRELDEVHEDRKEYAQGDIDFYPLVPIEGPAPNILPQPNLTGEPRNRPTQPIFLST